MHPDIRRAALAKPILAAALAVAAWYPASSFADDASYNTYRCEQGDSSACRKAGPEADVRVEKRLVLGPYALYLAQRGESREDAAAIAQAIGEQAVERTVRITKRELTQAEKYERVTSGLTTSDHLEETLSEVAVDARALRIASAASPNR